MSHSPAKVLQEYLISQGVFDDPSGSDPSWPIYVGAMPDTPDKAAAIFDVEGVKDGRLMDGPLNEHPGVEIMIRVPTLERATGWSKGIAVRDLFAATHNINISVGGEDYGLVNLSQTSPLLALGTEPTGTKRRWLFSLNFLCSITMEEVVPGIVIPDEAQMTINHTDDDPVPSDEMEGHFHTNKGAGSADVRLQLVKGTANKHAHYVQKDPGEFFIQPHADDHFEWSGGSLSNGQAFRLFSPVSHIYVFYSGDDTWTVVIEQGSIQPEE